MILDLIIIFTIAYLAATISGVAGFGGALMLLPLLSGVVGIKAAIPILTIGQIFGNASRVWYGRTELKWRPILSFMISATPLTIVGSYFFNYFNSECIKTDIGVFLILLVVYRRVKSNSYKLTNRSMILGGGLTGFLSGIAGSAGPLGAAFFLGLNLSAGAYIASEAFTALAMHLIKIVVYNKFSLIGQTELLYGVFIGTAMILGSLTGKRIAQKLSHEKFVILVETLLILSGIQMIIIGIN